MDSSKSPSEAGSAGTAPGRPSSFPEGWIDRGTPEFRRVCWSLCAAGFSAFAMLYFVQPLLPVFSADFSVSPAVSSLSLSATTETLAFALLVSGAVSDRIGRRPVMVVSLLASALLTLLSAAAPSWGWLIAARVLVGISLSGVQAVGMAYLAEEMRPRAFGFAIGLFIGGGVIGGMFGRLAISLLADVMSWRLATALLGVFALGVSLAAWRLLPASRNFHGRHATVDFASAFRLHLSDPVLVMLFAEAFLLMGGFVNIFNYMTFRLVEAPFSLGQGFVGAVFAVYLTGMVSSAWAGNLAARHGHARIFWRIPFVIACGLAMTLPQNLTLIVAGLAIFAFGFFAAHSVASGWVSQTARINKALAASLYLFSYYQGSSIAGVAGGYFWVRYGWTGTVTMTAAMLAVAFAIALVLRRSRPVAP